MARKPKGRVVASNRAQSHTLPPHPGGARWNYRHVIAAKMRAAGKLWPEVGQHLHVREDTVKSYTHNCKHWDVLYRHFLDLHLVELEDELLVPAVRRHKELLGSENEFVAVQAVQLAYGERRARLKRLDDLLAREQAKEPKDAAPRRLEVDITIRGDSED